MVTDQKLPERNSFLLVLSVITSTRS